VFVDGTPKEPGPTQKLLERIAFIRMTHYGGFYDFKPDLAMADTAYTNLALPVHTDNTYFTEPSGLQAFHLLSHEATSSTAEEPTGGETLLVDGFHAAKLLREENPEAFSLLKAVRLPWHASGNKGITLSPDAAYPVLELNAPHGPHVKRIRWNNDDRGVVPLSRGYKSDEWYAAARAWQAILHRKDVEYRTQLQPGRPLSESGYCCHVPGLS
jgi:trimethyllysine dioxygenase